MIADLRKQTVLSQRIYGFADFRKFAFQPLLTNQRKKERKEEINHIFFTRYNHAQNRLVFKVLLKRLESASWRVTKKRDTEKEAERPPRTLKCGLLYQTGGSNFRQKKTQSFERTEIILVQGRINRSFINLMEEHGRWMFLSVSHHCNFPEMEFLNVIFTRGFFSPSSFCRIFGNFIFLFYKMLFMKRLEFSSFADFL
jgi:hypothetical protein